MHIEVAFIEAKIFMILGEHPKKIKDIYLLGEYALSEAIHWLCLIVTIHEDVSTRRVTVEVTKEEDVSGFKSFLHHHFGVIIDGIKFGRGTLPLSI